MAKVRTGSGKLLPSIKSSYHDQYNDPSEREIWPTPRGGVDSRAISRFVAYLCMNSVVIFPLSFHLLL